MRDSDSPENHFLELVEAELSLITVDHAAQLDARSLLSRTKALKPPGVPGTARRGTREALSA